MSGVDIVVIRAGQPGFSTPPAPYHLGRRQRLALERDAVPYDGSGPSTNKG
jgi:hypothetical protein